MGNPAIYPLAYECESPDVVIVQINPLYRHEIPKTAREIEDRVNEISFNSSLMREMRAIAFVTSLIQKGKIARGEMKEVLIHSIRSDETMSRFAASSKLDTDWSFLCELRDLGRAQADQWLTDSRDAIGVRSSIDIREQFL